MQVKSQITVSPPDLEQVKSQVKYLQDYYLNHSDLCTPLMVIVSGLQLSKVIAKILQISQQYCMTAVCVHWWYVLIFFLAATHIRQSNRENRKISDDNTLVSQLHKVKYNLLFSAPAML